eukprot:3413194-Rhodomonas_salina.1
MPPILALLLLVVAVVTVLALETGPLQREDSEGPGQRVFSSNRQTQAGVSGGLARHSHYYWFLLSNCTGNCKRPARPYPGTRVAAHTGKRRGPPTLQTLGT